MNYVELSLKQSPSLLLCGTDGDVIESCSLFDGSTDIGAIAADSMISHLKELNWEYDGLVLVVDKGTLTDADFESIKGLEEKLNLPLVFKQDISKEPLENVFKKRREIFTWSLDYYDYLPGRKEYGVETLLTVGNGYLGLRGTLPEMTISDNHYPATYIAGQYNEAVSEVEGKLITNEDFVNSANLQFLTIQFSDGKILELSKAVVQSLTRHLDLKTGLFHSVLVVDVAGKKLQIDTKRVVNMANKHHYSLEYTILPLNFSEKLTLISKSDGNVYNYNTERYRQLTQHHLNIDAMTAEGPFTKLVTTTKESGIQVTQVSELVVTTQNDIQYRVTDREITQSVTFYAEEGQPSVFEKNVTVTSRSLKQVSANQPVEPTPVVPQDFSTNYEESKKAWQDIWQKIDIEIDGDMMTQKLLRLHGYHLLVSGSPMTIDHLDVSITARGLHGEAYRGHIFWDEIFILPFYQLHFPEMTRQLLMYRYNRLGQAKVAALAEGNKGAMFPWQSGLDGSEQSQEIHLNPLNGQWVEDYSRLQRHVSLSIAYNILNYVKNTNDQQFMTEYGHELLLEIAAYWSSKAIWSDDEQGYIIKNVMGPDEFHESYPDSQEGGLNNNAYTNMMVAWLFNNIVTLVQQLSIDEGTHLLTKVDLTKSDITQMAKISKQLIVPITAEGLIAQFDGYFDLEEVDFESYKEKYGNIYRMDRILSAEGKSADNYQVAKQADALMTFYNLPISEVSRILERLGYEMPTDYLQKNYDYYIKRTSHGSTLSRIVHGQLAAQVGYKADSWELYQQALRSDYEDIQGGTIAEGIHTGVMAGTIMVTLQTYGGLDTRSETLSFKPNLPEKWQQMRFNFSRRQIDYAVKITQNDFEICASEATELIVSGERYQIGKDEQLTLKYRDVV